MLRPLYMCLNPISYNTYSNTKGYQHLGRMNCWRTKEGQKAPVQNVVLPATTALPGFLSTLSQIYNDRIHTDLHCLTGS